jgi:hypothetical protein
MSGFNHRPNNDGSVDSICLRCFRTIASNNHEWSLAMVESQHECDPKDVMRFEGLEIGERDQVVRVDQSDVRSHG